ncbi:hypothetical protein BaRGS_00011312 [Batillaria attramentaria]|uniref:Uncharacterized protein n=1 Tax=Batillaria attramentaria TaxID=370345 RepID=A0ABD0LDR1_9CAEN
MIPGTQLASPLGVVSQIRFQSVGTRALEVSDCEARPILQSPFSSSKPAQTSSEKNSKKSVKNCLEAPFNCRRSALIRRQSVVCTRHCYSIEGTTVAKADTLKNQWETAVALYYATCVQGVRFSNTVQRDVLCV